MCMNYCSMSGFSVHAGVVFTKSRSFIICSHGGQSHRPFSQLLAAQQRPLRKLLTTRCLSVSEAKLLPSVQSISSGKEELPRNLTNNYDPNTPIALHCDVTR